MTAVTGELGPLRIWNPSIRILPLPLGPNPPCRHASRMNDRERVTLPHPIKTPVLQAAPNNNPCLIVTPHFMCPLCSVITNEGKIQTS